ncbi:hypothetical protein [Pedobacter hartonius]|uniref:Uncharacterized protein n=1 Tax=Pedobacter hartonius TaxID=425514 RepID=A0A1H3WWN1_9SPHI|nr:hypothetical protein [Pedobacter hartonius]SDZ90608.1 hypothetical protein SAMN05443550_101393 [Pedobacter hartonius]
MGIADDFMNSFLAAYPQAGDGKLSMEELNGLMEKHQQKINKSPLDDFDGLSPEQMNFLLYAPFSPGGLLQFRKNIDVHLGKVPFFKLSEILVNEIQQAGSLKLTVNGNLPVRICELLCKQNLIYWPYMKFVKRIREEEIPYLWPLKQYLLDSGMVKKRNNALSLTKTGEKMLKESTAARFIQIFNYVVTRFHWGNFYGLQDDGKSGQMGWAYSLVLLAKYGDSPRKSDFYSFKLIQAFERDLWNAHQKAKEEKATEDYQRAYNIRFFECFANWFGLVTIERKKDHSISYLDQLIITKSELFDQLFEANYTR